MGRDTDLMALETIMMPGHSPFPWTRAYYAGTAGIDDANGSSVADAVEEEDAAVILRAVRSHEPLLAAARDALRWIARNTPMVDSGADPVLGPIADEADAIRERLRAAITKAERPTT